MHPLRWDAQVTAGKDLYVSESTDLVTTGVLDDGVHGALVRLGLV